MREGGVAVVKERGTLPRAPPGAIAPGPASLQWGVQAPGAWRGAAAEPASEEFDGEDARYRRDRDHRRCQREATLDEVADRLAELAQQAASMKKRAPRVSRLAAMNTGREKCAAPAAMLTIL